MLIIEKHVALKWVRAGVDIRGFEAPGYSSDTVKVPCSDTLYLSESVSTDFGDIDVKLPRSSSSGSAWRALTRARSLTNFGLTMLNGVILGGLLGEPHLGGLWEWAKLTRGFARRHWSHSMAQAPIRPLVPRCWADLHGGGDTEHVLCTFGRLGSPFSLEVDSHPADSSSSLAGRRQTWPKMDRSVRDLPHDPGVPPLDCPRCGMHRELTSERDD